jgi:flagellar biosynthesis regulator FlaF
MKTIFLILNLLTDTEAIRNVLHSCFTAALVSVGVFVLAGTYQVLRRSSLRRNTGALSRA